MAEPLVRAVPGIPPQLLLMLLLLGVTAALAAVLFLLQGMSGTTTLVGPIAPHPRQPTSMLVYVAVPVFLTFTGLVVRFPGLLMTYQDPVNSPDSFDRYNEAPWDLEVGDWYNPRPENTANLTAIAASRLVSGSPAERARAAHDLGWWTAVCPNYAPFTMPLLVRALGDADDRVKGAAAVAIGSTGGHGAVAIPALVAARGSGVKYFDYLLDEAVFLIEHSGTWPPEETCENVAMEELKRRAVQQADEPDKAQGIQR